MKRYSALCLFLALCLLFSCGGGKSTVRGSDPTVPATRELHKGVAWYQKGCYHASLPYLMRAHERFTALDDLPGIAMCMNNIGNVYRKIGDSRSAILFLESSHAIYMDLEDNQQAARALANKAAVLIEDDRLAEAEAVLETARDLSGDSGNPNVFLLNNQAVLLIRKKDYAAAEKLLMRARDASDQKNLVELATVNFSLGNLMTETGRYDDALNYFEQALSADRKTEFHDGIAGNLAAIASVYELQGDHAIAANYYQRSVKIYALLGHAPKVIETMELLETSAAAGHVDITVTRHFVGKWSKGEMLGGICK